MVFQLHYVYIGNFIPDIDQDLADQGLLYTLFGFWTNFYHYSLFSQWSFFSMLGYYLVYRDYAFAFCPIYFSLNIFMCWFLKKINVFSYSSIGHRFSYFHHKATFIGLVSLVYFIASLFVKTWSIEVSTMMIGWFLGVFGMLNHYTVDLLGFLNPRRNYACEPSWVIIWPLVVAYFGWIGIGLRSCL